MPDDSIIFKFDEGDSGGINPSGADLTPSSAAAGSAELEKRLAELLKAIVDMTEESAKRSRAALERSGSDPVDTDVVRGGGAVSQSATVSPGLATVPQQIDQQISNEMGKLLQSMETSARGRFADVAAAEQAPMSGLPRDLLHRPVRREESAEATTGGVEETPQSSSLQSLASAAEGAARSLGDMTAADMRRMEQFNLAASNTELTGRLIQDLNRDLMAQQQTLKIPPPLGEESKATSGFAMGMSAAAEQIDQQDARAATAVAESTQRSPLSAEDLVPAMSDDDAMQARIAAELERLNEESRVAQSANFVPAHTDEELANLVPAFSDEDMRNTAAGALPAVPMRRNINLPPAEVTEEELPSAIALTDDEEIVDKERESRKAAARRQATLYKAGMIDDKELDWAIDDRTGKSSAPGEGGTDAGGAIIGQNIGGLFGMPATGAAVGGSGLGKGAADAVGGAIGVEGADLAAGVGAAMPIVGAAIEIQRKIEAAILGTISKAGDVGGTAASLDTRGAAEGLNQLNEQFGLGGKVFAEFNRAMTKVSDGLEATARRLAPYSAELSTAVAGNEMRSVFGDMRRAQQLGPELAKFTEARSKLEQAGQDALAMIIKPFIPIMTRWMEGNLRMLEAIFGKLPEPDQQDVLDQMWQAMGGEGSLGNKS